MDGTTLRHRRQVDKYDGQNIYIGSKVVYELGNYLGGGASGSVYQALEISNQQQNEKSVAIKILNPLGFKMLPYEQFKNKCTVLAKGLPLTNEQVHGKAPYTEDNVWWLVVTSTRQILAAYEDPHRGQLRELTLPKCIQIWGWTPLGSDKVGLVEAEKRNISSHTSTVMGVGSAAIPIPRVAPKYLKWLMSRQAVCREMVNMMQIGEHPNVIALLEVLELIQDSKATLFLVLEYVNGGELFERMKVGGQGTPEVFALRYFVQLLSGIEYCHTKGANNSSRLLCVM